ncbi:hypothetical protein ACTXT7_003777 [Hymenolepis weldensis]
MAIGTHAGFHLNFDLYGIFSISWAYSTTLRDYRHLNRQQVEDDAKSLYDVYDHCEFERRKTPRHPGKID